MKLYRSTLFVPGNRADWIVKAPKYGSDALMIDLEGDRIGQFSIRINDQWRICFVWSNGNVDAVEIVDYH